MTPEKAIKTIKHGCIYRDKTGGEALKVAVDALEKQIPKKVVKRIFDEDQIISTTYFTCPNCNENVAHLMYCAYCGQALDWSDTE